MMTPAPLVKSVAGRTGAVTLTSADIGGLREVSDPSAAGGGQVLTADGAGGYGWADSGGSFDSLPDHFPTPMMGMLFGGDFGGTNVVQGDTAITSDGLGNLGANSLTINNGGNILVPGTLSAAVGAFLVDGTGNVQANSLTVNNNGSIATGGEVAAGSGAFSANADRIQLMQQIQTNQVSGPDPTGQPVVGSIGIYDNSGVLLGYIPVYAVP